MYLHAYYSESWFTVEGARLKARRLKQAGVPNLTNWRLLTLTMANRTLSRFAAYELGKQRLRRFLARLRMAFGRKFKWCWKLEFHEDGFAHWHLLIEYRERIPEEVLAMIEEWWGLGRANVKRVRQKEIDYVFKYVAKGPDDLPPWVLHHKGRIRVFQASAGFFEKRRPRSVKAEEPKSCLVPVSLLVRTRWDERKALLCEDLPSGSRRISIVKLPIKFQALLLGGARLALVLRVPLAVPGAVSISQLQAEEIKNEHRKYRGLAAIPNNEAAA